MHETLVQNSAAAKHFSLQTMKKLISLENFFVYNNFKPFTCVSNARLSPKFKLTKKFSFSFSFPLFYSEFQLAARFFL